MNTRLTGRNELIALLQRVSEAFVEIEGSRVAQIGSGVLVFVAVKATDQSATATRLAEKVYGFRILAGTDGRPDKSVGEVPGAKLLVVSQFTLAADTRKGRRADYGPAAPPTLANSLYEEFLSALRALGAHVETGRFGADMKVGLVNDGPVTFWLEVA